MINITKLLLLSTNLAMTSLAPASELSNSLTLEEKIGQLLMVHFHGSEANEAAKTLIQEVKVGGFIYYNWCNTLESPAQVSALSNGLQLLATQNRIPIPLLISADQEGGRVMRLKNGFTPIPSNAEIAALGSTIEAYKYAKIIGQEIFNCGVNMNLAPVVDINNNPDNIIIGDRSYGSTSELVTNFAREAVRGYRETGTITTLKHFPGHGDVSVDSHDDLPKIDKSIEQLERNELIPFRQLAKEADAIMTAHLLVPAFDPVECSTLSHNTLSYLRNEIGFKGVIISDSLVMQGAFKTCDTIDEVAIKALNAGCDILLLGGKLLNATDNRELDVEDIKRIHASLVKAVREKRVTEERVNEAVEKVLQLKMKGAGAFSNESGNP